MREREREKELERDKMRYNCFSRLHSSTSVIKRKTLRSVAFILLIIRKHKHKKFTLK